MSNHYEEQIARIEDTDSMVAFLRDALGWEIQEPETATRREAKVIEGMQGLNVNVRRLRPITEDDAYSLYFVEFESEYKRRDLRALLASVKRQEAETGYDAIEKTIYIVSQKNYKDVRFVLFRSKDRGQPEIRSFGWEKGEHLGRTLITDNLPKLAWERRFNWVEAWNVEALTKAFFKEISARFYDTVDAVRSTFPSEDDARLVVQTLFNRLLFLRFVEEKGWLNYNGEKRYLQALWRAGQADKNPLWPTRLSALFDALNHPMSDQVHVVAQPLIGNVHYLNGGLFEQQIDPTLPFQATVFDALLGEDGLFYRYNFIVEESTPLDVEIAIDPEMLGKIFEQLTISTKRHDTGSYYTPREIVQFMCREALVGYLGSKGLTEEKALKLVYEHDDSDLTNQEGTLAFDALKEIKVVDPACGSGAYLLGMLQELYALFEKLRRDDRKFSDDPAKEAHKRKLWIIEKNIYGVDLQAFATNTAMLRLWLTLLVEDTGEKPQPLPNLEYKIEIGDALLGPDPSQPVHWQEGSKKKNQGQSTLYDQSIHDVVADLRRFREEYQITHGPDKSRVKSLLEAKLAELRQKVTGSAEKDPAKFDWRVEFSDVFLDDPTVREPGFDAVVANPPYVRSQLLGPIRRVLRERFPDVYDGGADLYCYFYALAIQLLTKQGVFSFISSNKWFRSEYGLPLRSFVASKCSVRHIVDFGELSVFEAAATFPVIVVAQMGTGGSPTLTRVQSLRPPYPDVLALVELLGFTLDRSCMEGSTWILASAKDVSVILQMKSNHKSLRDYVTANGILGPKSGIKTGCNRAYFLDSARADELRANDLAAPFVKRLMVGDDARKWHTGLQERWSIVIPKGTLVPESNPVLSHLEPLRTTLQARSARGDYWYDYRSCTYMAAAFGPAIVFPDIGKEPRFTAKPEGVFPDYTLFFMAPCDLYLLGVLSSKTAWLFLSHTCPVLGDAEDGGRLRLQAAYVERLPVPNASNADRDPIVARVKQCLDSKAGDKDADVSEYEKEIDARVEFLYFHRGERGTRRTEAGEEVPYPDSYEEWVALKADEEGTAIEEVRKLLAIEHETNGFECKSSYAWDMKKDEPGDYLKDQVHIAICAMLNSNGGDLLVGVDDDMNILGLEKDIARFGNLDKLISAIEGPLGTTLKPNPIGLVAIESIRIDGKVILRIRITPNHEECYEFKDKIYVRRNSKSKPELTAAEAAVWWPKRKAGTI